MPPQDTTPPVAPTPPPAPEPQPKKPGFWAKLFGKKETPALVPPQSSHTPEPRLDEPVGDLSQPAAANPAAPVAAPVQPVAPVAPPTDSQPGAVESSVTDVHDTDGNVISPSLAVPDNLQNQSVGKNPTLPVAPDPQQAVPPQPPASQAPAAPPVAPPVQPQQPPVVPPAGPQPPQPPQQ